MKVRLHVQDGPQSFEGEYAGPAVTVGRNPASGLVLETDSPASVVSWDHARIDLSPREATLTDLRSTNGTYRNDQPVAGTVPLWPGDVIRFGVSGPVLTVREIDLSPVALSPPPAPAFAVPPPFAAAPVAVKPTRPKAKPAPAPAVSETRGILIEAIRQQQSAHSRQKRAVIAVAAGATVCLLLLLLLSGGLWSLRGRLGELFGVTEKLQDDVVQTQKSVEQLGQKMRAEAQQTAEHFAGVEQKLEDRQRADAERDRKLDQIAQQAIRHEADLRGGMDKLKQQLGATVDEINRRLVKPAAPAAAGGQADAAIEERQPVAAARRQGPGPRIEPGMKMDVIV